MQGPLGTTASTALPCAWNDAEAKFYDSTFNYLGDLSIPAL
jgi:hypothetical protein